MTAGVNFGAGGQKLKRWPSGINKINFMAGWELLNDSLEFHSEDITHSDTIERISLKSQIMYKQNHCGCTICCCFNMLLLSGTYQEESIQTLNQPTHPSVHHLPPCLPTNLDELLHGRLKFGGEGPQMVSCNSRNNGSSLWLLLSNPACC